MKIRNGLRSCFVLGVLGFGALAPVGCVSDRPARNGVFDENQYVRKDFLVRPGDGSGKDNGWILKATVTKTSSPNPLGTNAFNIFPGTENNGGAFVRFDVTSDKLQMYNLREITNSPDPVANDPEVVNSWPITNVDLKYRVNLDGEKTNFLEENQELDWKARQWVKVNFDKNDMSDLAPLGNYTASVIGNCIDSAGVTTTLVPDSFQVDEPNNYLQWTVQVTLPLRWDDATCVAAYSTMGVTAEQFGGGFTNGRQNVTLDLMYSMVRATDRANVTYHPLLVDEKDPIRHKYGFFDETVIARDNGDGSPGAGTGQLAAKQYVQRFDPTKPIVWYFEQGFPEDYKTFFNGPGGIAEQTNKIFNDSGVGARVYFVEWNGENPVTHETHERHYGDVRYSFLRWLSDRDVQDTFAGVTQFINDPLTGEVLSSSINFNDFAIKDYYTQRIDTFLQSLGASPDGTGVNSDVGWLSGSCDPVATPQRQIVNATLLAKHNGQSSLFQKMKQYFPDPGIRNAKAALGPQDFIAKHDATADADFFDAYYKILPYQIYGDPDANQFVIREGGAGVFGATSIWQRIKDEAEFHKTAAAIDQGQVPFEDVTGAAGLTNATTFLNRFRDLTVNHEKLDYALQMAHPDLHMDSPSAFSFESVMQKDAQHCVNGQWETREDWEKSLLTTYWSQVAWHEFGHSLGLAHNFMASVDKPNFPNPTVVPAWVEPVLGADGKQVLGEDQKPMSISHPATTQYGLYASSVMEYNAAPDRIFWKPGWAPYDQGAISWIFSNNDKAPGTTDSSAGTGISGQTSPSSPWNDRYGFDAQNNEIQYLFCTHKDMPYTPLCRQGDLGTTPSEIIANDIEMYEWEFNWRNFRKYRKFWNNSAYANTPANLVSEMRRFLSLWQFDWGQGELADKFRRLGVKNPDPNGSDLAYYDALTNKFTYEASAANQMVAAFHKAIILQSSGERPYKTEYDPYYGDTTKQGIILDKLFAVQGWVGMWPTLNYDQNQAGYYLASYSGLGDDAYRTVAEDAVDAMIGGQYDAYAYVPTLPIAQFAQDTHSPSFSGRIDVRDWIGGHTFTRLDDFLSYFRDIATQNNFPGCESFDVCKYDPRDPSISDTHNEFFGPDKRVWIWAYIPDRNTWVTVEKERNTASYLIVRNYNDYFVTQQDDGAFPGGVYGTELPMKYFLDSFNQFN